MSTVVPGQPSKEVQDRIKGIEERWKKSFAEVLVDMHDHIYGATPQKQPPEAPKEKPPVTPPVTPKEEPKEEDDEPVKEPPAKEPVKEPAHTQAPPQQKRRPW